MKSPLRISARSLLGILCLALAVVPVSANTLYSNGSINGNLNAFFIDGLGGPFGQSISDGFVASASGTATSLNFGEWTLGGAPTVVSWAVGTSSFGSQIASGAGAVTSTFLGTNGFGYGIYDTQISISGALTAGDTYYLTLSGANDSGGTQFDAWDDNEGPRELLLPEWYRQRWMSDDGVGITYAERQPLHYYHDDLIDSRTEHDDVARLWHPGLGDSRPTKTDR